MQKKPLYEGPELSYDELSPDPLMLEQTTYWVATHTETCHRYAIVGGEAYVPDVTVEPAGVVATVDNCQWRVFDKGRCIADSRYRVYDTIKAAQDAADVVVLRLLAGRLLAAQDARVTALALDVFQLAKTVVDLVYTTKTGLQLLDTRVTSAEARLRRVEAATTWRA